MDRREAVYVTTWIGPYIRRMGIRKQPHIVRGYLKKINNPTKRFGDHARELATDMGYSVTRARRAMHLGIEREWEIFNDLNPGCMEWDDYWSTYGGI